MKLDDIEAQVSVLHLEPGDTLVVSVPQVLSTAMCETIRREVADHFASSAVAT